MASRRTHARRLMIVAGGALAMVVAAADARARRPARPRCPATPRRSRRRASRPSTTTPTAATRRPAIGPDGTINGGLNPTGSLNGDCHDAVRPGQHQRLLALQVQQRLVRRRVRPLLREGPGASPNSSIGGHRHDWEHVVVWVQNGVSASTSPRPPTATSPSTPASSVRWTGTHPKVVYHKDGVSTHCFRLGRHRRRAAGERTTTPGSTRRWSAGTATRAGIRDKLSRLRLRQRQSSASRTAPSSPR